jgi:hypothetical protein
VELAGGIPPNAMIVSRFEANQSSPRVIACELGDKGVVTSNDNMQVNVPDEEGTDIGITAVFVEGGERGRSKSSRGKGIQDMGNPGS